MGRGFLVGAFVFLGVFLFQNCKDFESKKVSIPNPNTKQVWSLNREIFTGRNAYFYLNPNLFSQRSNITWAYTLNDKASGCAISRELDSPNVGIEILCNTSGLLKVLAFEGDQVFTLERQVVFYENPDTLREFDIYYSIEELYLNLDGSYGVAYSRLYGNNAVAPPPPTSDGPDVVNPKPPTQTTENGAGLYAVHCAQCHLDLENSTKKGQTSSAIGKAIQTRSEMRTSELLGLSSAQIQAIAEALR